MFQVDSSKWPQFKRDIVCSAKIAGQGSKTIRSLPFQFAEFGPMSAEPSGILYIFYVKKNTKNLKHNRLKILIQFMIIRSSQGHHNSFQNYFYTSFCPQKGRVI